MSKTLKTAALALAGLALLGLPAGWAAGNLASKPTTIELKIDSKTGKFSATEFTGSVGKYYKWHVTGDGGVVFRAQALFDNSWINLVGVNVAPCDARRCDAEILPASSIDGIKFNGGYGVDIFFVPLKVGEYEFSVLGQEAKGMVGKFRVTP